MPIPFMIVEPVELLWEEGAVELEAPVVTVAVLLAVEVVAPDRLAVWIDDDFVAEGVSNVPPPPEVAVKLLSGFSRVSVEVTDVKAVIVVPSQMAGTPFT